MKAIPHYTSPPLTDAFPIVYDQDEKDGIPMKSMILRLEDPMMDFGGNSTPDISGCEKFFIDSFLTDDMADDFPLIIHDFFKHEFKNLSEYAPDIFSEPSMKFDNPVVACQYQFLKLIYSAAKAGSAYSIRLIKDLYKTYHHTEYQQLKHFQALNSNDIGILAKVSGADVSAQKTARILTMSRFFGIKLHPMCNWIYPVLRDAFEKNQRKAEKERGRLSLDLPSPFFEECKEQAQRWMSTVTEPIGKVPQMNRFKRMAQFLADSLRYFHYPQDYMTLCDTAWENITDSFAHTLAFLRLKYPEENFSFEEVQTFCLLFDCAGALTSVSDDLRDFWGRSLGLISEWPPDVSPLFHSEEPEAYSETGMQPWKVLAFPNTWFPAPKKAAPADKESPPAVSSEEILALQKKIRQQEQEIRHLQGLYEAARKEKADASAALEQHRNERQELIALRNHVYQSTEEDVLPSSVNLSAMEQAIRKKRIIIIGGHANWTSKLKNKFQNWIFLTPKTSGSIDNRLLNHADYVFFFTDFIQHSTYFRFIKIVREKGISFGYLHSTNIPANIQQIYREML